VIIEGTEAQLSQNKIESIANQTNVSTSPQINVGNSPTYISYRGNTSTTEDSVYVANSGSNTVSVINPDITTVKTIAVGINPVSIAISPFGDSVYVVTEGSNNVSVIDPANNIVIKNIAVGNLPASIAISPFEYSVYVANEGSNTVSVIALANNTVIKNLTTGINPALIAISPFGDSVYVANEGSNTVSVINSTNNTVIKNITVGILPLSIAISPFGDSVYVANYVSDTVSVINSTNNTVIKNITVGNGPESIAILPEKDFVYVVNSVSNTVSVIDSTNNTVIKNITVGNYPFSIATSPLEDSVYVTNYVSNTVSVIDPATNKVVAGVTFDVIPFRGGQIICNGIDAPINRYFYVSSGTECVANPNNGYEFASWVETFDDNSTRTISASTTSDWLVDPLGALRDVFTDDPAATLAVNKFSSYTAYFKALPPPVPAEFTVSLITVIVAALVGSLLIPAAVSWLKSKKQTSRLNSFHLDMVSINNDGLDETDIKNLNELNQRISNSYAAGKITNEQYTNLKNEVSAAYQKIFKKRIEFITDPNTKAVNNIKNDIEDAYSDRKITELDYNLLNGKISRMLDNK
jgi:YVTN family beta-propeller protein